MKNVNVKDVEATEVETETKKFDIKKLFFIIIMGIVTLVGIFFWSTKIRWDAEIEDHYKILYYGQEEIEINELVDFYGEEVNPDISDTEALLMYCESEYGKNCVMGDYNNGFENLLRNPSIVIEIVILIDLVLLFLLLKDKCFGKVKTYIIFGIVLILGLINLGKVIFDFANYYGLVNDTEYVVDAEIVGQLVTNNTKEYYPVVKYTTEQGKFNTYIEVPLKGQVTERISEDNKITVYYDRIDNSVCTIKQSLIKYILPSIVSLLYIISAIVYLIIYKRKNNQ